MFSKVI